MRERELTRRIREFFRLGSGDVQTQVGGSAYNPAAVAITGGTIQLNDGTQNAPSYSFASAPTSGLLLASSNLMLSIAGSGRMQWGSSGGAGFMQFASGGGTFDATLMSDGANIIAHKNGNVAQESRVYAGNGGFISLVKSVNESLTIAAAATTVSATTIPTGAILLAVSPRVTTVIPTAATFTLTTTTGGTTLTTAAVSTAANSTDAGTAAGASYRAAATTVTVTPNLTPGTATGVVRLTFYYIQVTPPTS